MTKRSIYITQGDLQRLLPLMESARHQERNTQESLDLLQEELDRAILCNAEDLPPDVVSMNSEVTVTDLQSGKKSTYTLVFPRDAKYDEGRISVLAPLGAALLGYRTGMEVEWPTPGGTRTFRIERVKQPARKRIASRIA